MEFNYCPGTSFESEDKRATFERLMRQGKEKDLSGLRKELSSATFGLSKLIDLVHDKQIGFPKWMLHIEALIVKLIQHTASLNHLAVALPIFKRDNGSEKSYFDTASLFVIARAQIEAFLTFYYLIISPDTLEQGEFYDMVYELSGLCNRQQMPATSELNLRQKSIDANRIVLLRQRIENHPYLLLIANDLKNKIKGSRPPARLINGWEDLIRQSHLNERFFVPQWKHYSGYAHSEFISSMQLPTNFEDPAFVFDNVCATVQMALITISVTIIEVLNLIPELQEEYSTLWTEEQRICIYFYSKHALKPGIQNKRQFIVSSVILH